MQDIEFVYIHPFFPVIAAKGFFGKVYKHLLFIIWKQFLLPILARLKNCNFLICTDYFLPSYKGSMKHIVVFHDAFFFEYPSHYNILWLKLFYKWAVPNAVKSDVILVPSNYVKQRLTKFLPVNQEDIHVVYEAPKTFEIQGISKSEEFALIGKKNPFLLHVGVLCKHKNLPAMIHAFGKAIESASSDWHLILVGGSIASRNDDDTENIKKTIKNLGLSTRVHLMGYVQDEYLGDFYKNASGYIFPSYNEGFGLPVLEAMEFGLPIAAANNSCLPEVAKDAAIYFNPFDVNEIQEAICKILTNDPVLLATLERQPTVLSQYSWSKAVLEIVNICKQLN